VSPGKRLLTEKIPFILFAFGAGILAFWAKKGSMIMVAEHGIIDRFMQATYGLCFYIYKTVVPIRLSPFYLLDKTFNPMAPKYVLCALSVFGITIALAVMRPRRPWALTAWICYAVIVSPLLGFVQSGPQIAADRYTYIACMPFGVLAGAGVYRLYTARQGKRLSAVTWFAVVTAILAGMLVMSSLSFRQTRIYHDNYTFWNRAIQVDPTNHIAFNNRGVFLKEQKNDLIGALADYNTAIELDPEYAGTYYNRGLLHEMQEEFGSAIADYSSVIRLNPKHAEAYNNRGGLRNRQGDSSGALKDFNTAIRLAPFSSEAYANRGMLRLSQNELQGAVQDFTKALEVASAGWPSKAQVEKVLGNIRIQLDGQDYPGRMPG